MCGPPFTQQRRPKAGHRAADLILDEVRSLGLHEARKEPFSVYAWDFAGASLAVEDWDSMPASSFPPTSGTPQEGFSTLLVDAGYGTARDYVGLDVRDRIAFVQCRPLSSQRSRVNLMSIMSSSRILSRRHRRPAAEGDARPSSMK